MEAFSSFVSSPNSYCLQNQPNLQPSYKAAICGNGQLEEGEICDCGELGCEDNPPPCCDPKTCGLSQGSACAIGPCCDKCNVKRKGQVCRPTTGECDLTEYCNGTSAMCEEDFFIHDGYPCGEDQWICVNGSCQSGEKQCHDVFGSDTDFGTNECYEELNSKSDISGNCGISPSGYQACAPKYALGNVTRLYHLNLKMSPVPFIWKQNNTWLCSLICLIQMSGVQKETPAISHTPGFGCA